MKAVATLGNREMAVAIKDAIECLTTIPTEPLSIEAQEGWIYLSGELENRHQKEFVEEVVRHLPGVLSVINWITVEPHPASRN